MPESQGSEDDASPGPPDPVGDLKRMTEPIRSFHADHPVYFWFVLVGLLGGTLGLGALLWPETVVDDFLWKNFWGPTQTDAEQVTSLTRNGVTATTSYTLLSEIVYGVILAGALVSIYQHLFKKRGISVDGRFIAALLPYVFFGPIARAMEDASVFCEQATPVLRACDPGGFSWLFISPFIYMLTAAAVIIHLMMAHRTDGADRGTQNQVVAAWLGVQVAVYAFVFYAMRDQFVAMVEPWAVLGLAVLAFAVYYVARERGGSHLHWSLASWGIPMVSIPIVLISSWIRTGSEVVSESLFRIGWVFFDNRLAYEAVLGKATPEILLATAGLVLLVLGIVAGVGYLLRNRFDEASYFLAPLNLGLIGAHMVDGWATFAAICSTKAGQVCSGATFLGLDIPPYAEKHPVSAVFLGFGDGWGFPAMKLLLVVLIVLLVDRAQYKEDEDPDLIGLVKLAVLVLGLGPGTRNAVRVAMGL